MRGRISFVIAILLFALIIILFSLQMPSFKAKFLPLLCGTCLFITSIARLYIEFKKGEESKNVQSDTPHFSLWEHPLIITYAWLVSFFFLIFLIGFSLAIFIFVTAYIQVKRGGWAHSISLGFISSGSIYFLFDYLLRLDLYPGLVYLLIQRFEM
jgi:hypothetical protein